MTKRDVLNGTIVDDTTDALAVQYNGMGGGKMGRSRVQADTAFSNALQLITTVEVDVQTADRLLDVFYSLTLQSDAPGGAQVRVIEDDGATTTVIGRDNYSLARVLDDDAPPNHLDHGVSGTFEASPAGAGTYTYSLYIGPSGVDGNSVRNMADDPDAVGGVHGFSYLWVYDVAKLGDFA